MRSLLVGLLLCSAAYAQEPKYLSVEQAIRVTNGLGQLDGYDGTCKDGATEKTCRKLYNLGMGVRMTIAKNMDKGVAVGKIYNKARQDLIAQLSEGGTKVPDENMSKFLAEDAKAQEASSGVIMDRINKSDLKLDENPIPATVLYQIIPILND